MSYNACVDAEGESAREERHGFLLDMTALPVVSVRYPESMRDIEPMRWLFGRYSQLARRGQPLCWRHDLRRTRASVVNARIRREIADLDARHRVLFETVGVCEARIFASDAMRLVATGYDWIAPRGWALGNFMNPEDADAFIAKHRATRGI